MNEMSRDTLVSDFLALRDAPALLDLYCGAGGACVGYQRAGFAVIGVDHLPQPNYPSTFIQVDALSFLMEYGTMFDVIHASPPCQAYTSMRRFGNYENKHKDTLDATLTILESYDIPYVCENVPGAPLHNPIMLCGQMFGLDILRHRLFQSNILLAQPEHIAHTTHLVFTEVNATTYRDAMGCYWMTGMEGRQAIPPVYTQYIGQQLMKHLGMLSEKEYTIMPRTAKNNSRYETMTNEQLVDAIQKMLEGATHMLETALTEAQSDVFDPTYILALTRMVRANTMRADHVSKELSKR